MPDFNFGLENVEDYYWLTIDEDEEIQWVSHPTLLPEIPTIIMGILISIVSVIGGILFFSELQSIHERGFLLPIATFFVGVAAVIIPYARTKSTFYVITTDKFVRKDKIFGLKKQSKPLSKINDVNTDQGFIQQQLKFGTVYIATAGTDGFETELTNVPNPEVPDSLLRES